MVRVLVVWLFIAGCRIYDPRPLDCRITCGAEGECPSDTACREGFCRVAGATGRCECRDGEERRCGSSQGTCVPGVQRCAGTEWGACEGAIGAMAERCNGLDDDCDGLVDEEIALPPVCERTFGVCAGARQRCLEGAFRACEVQSYGPDFEADEISCDGLDNDCDGVVDGSAAVQLSTKVVAPWFLLATPRGFALVSAEEARWLSRELELEALVTLDAGASLATSRGDSLILATLDDAGVVFTTLDADGGSTAEAGWASPTTLDLSGDFAAAIVNGEVQLRSLSDGGVRSVGADTDGTLRLSQTGESLAWSGGVTRTADLVLLRDGGVGPLLALIDLESAIVAGVPAGPTSQPVFWDDLLTATAPRAITPFPVPALSGQQANEHRGRVLLVGLEGTTALWLVNERGTQRRLVGTGMDSVRLPPSREAMATFAWKQGREVWGIRRCAP
ncbi:MAG: MopE-related protein [Archangium sp.]|nr:MopE-related protein [Archangium sp.]